MNLKNKRQSVIDANKRRLVFYPNKRNFSIFIGVCFQHNKRRASLMDDMLQLFLSKLTEEQKKEYIEIYKQMSEEQIKNVGYNGEEGD